MSAPVFLAPPEGPLEVWALTDDGAGRILSTDDEAHAQTTFRKRGHAVVRGGAVLRFSVNLSRAQQAVLKHAVKYPPATTPTPPTEEVPAVHENPVTKIEADDATETSTCTAKDCDSPHASVRETTRPDVVDFCAMHRQRTYERAGRWKVPLAVAARTVREGTSERPPEAPASRRGQRDTKPSQSAKPVKRGATKKPARKPKTTPSQSPTEALGARLASLRGVTEERVREIAHEVVEEELAKLLKVFE